MLRLKEGKALRSFSQGEFIDNVVMPQVNSGKDILIVGHGAMNCSIIAKFRGTPLDKFWDGMTDNCQVVKLI